MKLVFIVRRDTLISTGQKVVVIRTLECGHRQPEKPGGLQASATRARCQRCAIDLVRPGPKAPIGKCGAVVMNPKLRRTHLCDRDAFELKRGQPRCARHLRKGAA